MGTFKQIESTVFIDDLEIPLHVFTILEPSYNSASVEILTYDGSVRNVRSGGRTTSVYGRWEDGERYISRKKDFATLLDLIQKDETETAAEVDPLRDPIECRKREYPLADDLVVALWEHLVEKKSLSESGIKALQEKRKEVKDKYPLKETKNGDSNDASGTEGVLLSGTRRTRSRNKHSG